MIPYNWIEESEKRIRPYIRETPLTYDKSQDLYLKWENHQVTGSFKARGAFNKVMLLQPWERQQGLVTASAGNHGQGLALAGSAVGAQTIIFASEHAVPEKVQAMRALGADVRLVAGGYGEAEAAGLEYSTAHHATWVSPYNDGQVIAGQGTLGLETLRQLPSLPASGWIVPVGGGGLIAGIGAAIKPSAQKSSNQRPERKLFAVQSEASPFFYAIYHQGSQNDVVELSSLADGLSGPVEANSLTIPLVQVLVDDIVLVTEAEIIKAIAYAWNTHHEKIEGSAAVSLAAVISGKISTRPAVVIISGGNIQPEVHSKIIGSG